MKTNKTLVRLTEQELHNIIKESVNRLLAELDWKTLANAEKKARTERNDPKRAEQFADAARDAFDRDYGYQRGGHLSDDDYQYVGMGGDFQYSDELAPHALGWKNSFPNIKLYPYGMTTKEKTPQEFFNNNQDAVDAYNNAEREINNYRKGKYQYHKDKGWHLM